MASKQLSWDFGEKSLVAKELSANEDGRKVEVEATEPVKLPFVFYELVKPEPIEDSKAKYLVAEYGNEREILFPRTPEDDDLYVKIAALGDFQGEVKFYLNGMKTSGLSWAHATKTGSEVHLWKRNVQCEEFDVSRVIRLRNSVRTWTDLSGKFSVNARLYSRNGDRLVLFAVDGRRIEIDLDRLSPDDIAYVKQQ